MFDRACDTSHLTDFPVSNESKLMAWMERYPNATHFPDHIDRIVKQMERKERQDVHPEQITMYGYDVYQTEKALEHDLMGKSDRHDIRQALVEYLENAFAEFPIYKPLYGELCDKLRIARTTGAVGIDPFSGRHITAWDDKVNCVRLCPDEAREETQRLVRKYAPEIFRLCNQNPNYRIYYAVYTEPNVPANELSEGKRKQYRKFSNFHRSTWAKQRIKGSFVIQEDPLATNDKDWNVHLNAIHVVEGEFSYKELRSAWGNNVEVRQIKGTPEEISKTFLEVVKYAAKHIGEKSEDGKHVKSKGMTSWTIEQFHEWFSAGKGFRRSRTYGCLYRFEGTPDKGISLDSVVWIGQVQHDGSSYQVHLKKNLDYQAANGVDLIQSDNFASLSGFRDNSGSLKPPLII